MTVEKLKLYGVNIDVEGIKDNGEFMQSSTYLNKMKGTPID